jgi:hypothetical protein
MSSASVTPIDTGRPNLVVQGATVAVAEMVREPAVATPVAIDLDNVRAQVIAALEKATMPSVMMMLDQGSWRLAGDELMIDVAQSDGVIDMVVNVEARRVITSAANKAAERTLKVRIAGGKDVPSSPSERAPRIASAPIGSARQRAAEDPIVRAMQEKFNAEIRTVIDHREKNR